MFCACEQTVNRWIEIPHHPQDSGDLFFSHATPFPNLPEWTQNSMAFLCVPLMAKGTVLTHWGRVTHICVGRPTIIGSDNGLSPERRQAIIWTNAGILFIGSLGTNFTEISFEILAFSFTKMRLKVSSAKRRSFCLGLNVLTHSQRRNKVYKIRMLNNFIAEFNVSASLIPYEV